MLKRISADFFASGSDRRDLATLEYRHWWQGRQQVQILGQLGTHPGQPGTSIADKLTMARSQARKGPAYTLAELSPPESDCVHGPFQRTQATQNREEPLMITNTCGVDVAGKC